ncbi:hypothetical protein [Deinococcus sp. JMULE3]|uniref:hypothetical protein n=1 Tax=Deinococcus sp. JMULE3 TaxID=2518341 RepID=UPI001576CC0A|nr:hypothetical protein [Deinococcus sp. JMULE3]NTY00842.1 hypothetical protein [Deinococcus sp. JMULE3]
MRGAAHADADQGRVGLPGVRVDGPRGGAVGQVRAQQAGRVAQRGVQGVVGRAGVQVRQPGVQAGQGRGGAGRTAAGGTRPSGWAR